MAAYLLFVREWRRRTMSWPDAFVVSVGMVVAAWVAVMLLRAVLKGEGDDRR